MTGRIADGGEVTGLGPCPAGGRDDGVQLAGGDRIALLHTEVPEALSGKGVGSKLVRGVLDALRAEGSRVVPRCEFAAAYVGRHPEYRDLLADER